MRRRIEDIEARCIDELPPLVGVETPDVAAPLQMVEDRPEIGIIEDLAVTRLANAGYDQQAKVTFSMVVGRTTLDKP